MARVNLASLAREDGADAPAPAIRPPGSPSVAVPVRRVALNPINPRELDPATANLSDLESMKKLGQLQACTVVTAPAFLEIYPEHAVDVDGADWVVVAPPPPPPRPGRGLGRRRRQPATARRGTVPARHPQGRCP